MCGAGDDEGVLHDDGHTVMIEELQDSALKPLYENLPHVECMYWVIVVSRGDLVDHTVQRVRITYNCECM
jgi:hypothetical protein